MGVAAKISWQTARGHYIPRMASPPLILVSPSIERRGVEFGDLSLSLSLKYENAVLEAGGIPVVAPITNDRALLAEAVRRTDGVLLTGGDDINPDLYEEKLLQKIRKTVVKSPDGGARDLQELILIEEIFRQRKPVFAICRGHQLMNVAFGGKLVVDIRQQVPGALNHQRLDKACEFVHEVALTAGSLLARISQSQVLGVNSSHHQAVRETAGVFVGTAHSADGLVEAMELQPEIAAGRPFFLSVQFHPERLTQKHGQHRAMFRQFVAACGQIGRKKT
jgi:putative glutamine amidotransferase